MPKARSIPRAPVELSAEDQVALDEVHEHYRRSLKETPAALDFLERRGLNSPDLIEHFRVGYSARTLLRLLPEQHTSAGKKRREQLQRLGVLRHGGHETLGGMLVVPIFGEEGRIVQMYGRRTSPPASRGDAIDAYLPAPYAGVFNEAALAISEELIIAESPWSALTFWCAGHQNVTSTFGVDGTSQELLQALQRHRTTRVIITFPRTSKADRCAASFAKQLAAMNVGAFRVEFPKTMDANAYAARFKPAARSLGLLIRNARWLGEGPAPERSTQLLPLEATRSSSVSPSIETSARPTAEAYAPTDGIETEMREHEVILRLSERRYRVRGLAKNLSPDLMRINLLAAHGEQVYVDVLDLYTAKARIAFVKAAATELGLEPELVKRDVAKVLLRLEVLQEEQIRRTLTHRRPEQAMTAGDREAALELLRDPQLLDRILEDFDRVGVVGERTNKLVAYLAAVSRKLEDPLAIVIQSASAAGKSSVLEAVLAFVPEEDRLKFSAVTPKSLYYLGESNLQHKVLAIVEEQGAGDASYALKLLQSERELTIASTGRDAMTGKIVTEEYCVRGPVALFLTTTAVDVDEELLNRALVLAVSDDREQTRAIHRLQRKRETLAGLLEQKAKQAVLRVHQNAQRLLRSLAVVNPFAESLSFADHGARTRRDHAKYLALIRTIALLHQHQRPARSVEHDGEHLEYIEVEVSDIEIANRLANEVLGRSVDDLAPQTRALLMALRGMQAEAEKRGTLRADFRFGRREIQAHTGWSYQQVRIHLARLLEREHVVLHASRRGERHQYELLADDKVIAGGAVFAGLADVQNLGAHDPRKNGSAEPNLVATLSPVCAPVVGGVLAPSNGESVGAHDELNGSAGDPLKKKLPTKRAAKR